MSSLIKSIKKKVRKVFSFVKKVWKKLRKSKILKAIAVAAIIYFSAGALAGYMSTGGLSGAAAGIGESFTALSGGLTGAGSIGANLSGNLSTLIGSTGTAATSGGRMVIGGSGNLVSILPPTATVPGTGLAGALKGMTAAQATLIQTGANFAQGRLQANAKSEALKKERKLREEANATQLNIRGRLSKYSRVEDDPQSDAPRVPKFRTAARKFYDENTDTYVGVS